MNKYDELISNYNRKLKLKKVELDVVTSRMNQAEKMIMEYENINEEYKRLTEEEDRLLQEETNNFSEQLLDCHVKLQVHYDYLKPYTDIICECIEATSKINQEISDLRSEKINIINEKNSIIAYYAGNRFDNELDKEFDIRMTLEL